MLEDKVKHKGILNVFISISIIHFVIALPSIAMAITESGVIDHHPVKSNTNFYLKQIAHQETVKPYRYYLDGDKLYYQ
ncbi:hypothetical protein ACGEN4_04860 [Limosilactobacillus mucosae]|uniref:hypothetical protein n=1 Tax=Limosilactobacillus mucosae TaxID=97478 RepID=UPI000704A89D|nr:hypothetical protein [Limosilactobacillus mucosae]